MTQNNNSKKPSQELELLIEEYFRQFLKARELYLEIESKAIKEEGFTLDEIEELVLNQRHREVLRNVNNKNNNKINTPAMTTNTATTNTATNNSNKNEETRYFQHFQ